MDTAVLDVVLFFMCFVLCEATDCSEIFETFHLRFVTRYIRLKGYTILPRRFTHGLPVFYFVWGLVDSLLGEPSEV